VVCLGLFAVLISHNAQTHALVAGEEYRTLDESALLRFVGQNELELQQGRDTILGKYSTKDKTVRSTFRIGGTDVVRYFDVVSDGILRDRTTNRLFYSRKELAKAKKQAEEMARKERERREEAARIELKRQEQESQQASRMRQLAHVLYESAKKGDIEQVSRLLKEGADPNVQPQRHPSALWVSAYNGDANVARTLLDAGAKLESTSILAEDRQFSEDNELYLENLEPRSWERRALRLTELDVAIIRRQPDTVRLLLDRGANPNHFVYRCSQRIGSEKFDMQCLAHFSTPLNLAIQMGYGTEIISELLKHKADPNLASISHPLFLAIEAGSV
jgi:ankyrin repeat protein